MQIPAGINWQESRQRYQVRITRNGRRYHLGRFKTLAEAKKVLQNACNSNWY